MALIGCCGSDEPHLGPDGPPTLLTHPQLWTQDPYLSSILNLCSVLEQCCATADFQLSHHQQPGHGLTSRLDLRTVAFLWTCLLLPGLCMILNYGLTLWLELTSALSLWNWLMIWTCGWNRLAPLSCLGWTPLSEAALLAALSPGFPSLKELLPDGLVWKKLERKLAL